MRHKRVGYAGQLKRNIQIALCVVGLGIIGSVLFLVSQAATPVIGVETESGQLTGDIKRINIDTASGKAAVLFGATGGSEANVIIVSTTGNDTTGNGSVAAPYKTIIKAQAVAAGGATVYLRAGVYAGTVTLTKSGTSGQPIIYASYPGESAVISGSSTDYYGEAVLYLKQLHDVVIKNIELQNGAGQGLKIESGKNITIADNKIHNISLGGLVVSGDTITLSGNEVYNTVLANNNGQYGNGGWPAAFATELTPGGAAATNITLTGNYSHDNWGEGLGLFHANGAVMDNNQSINNYSVNIYSDESKNLQITNNSVSSTNDIHNRKDNGHRPTGIAVASEQGQVAPTNIIINANTVGSGLFAGIVKFTNGYGNVTQGPNPQNF